MFYFEHISLLNESAFCCGQLCTREMLLEKMWVLSISVSVFDANLGCLSPSTQRIRTYSLSLALPASVNWLCTWQRRQLQAPSSGLWQGSQGIAQQGLVLAQVLAAGYSWLESREMCIAILLCHSPVALGPAFDCLSRCTWAKAALGDHHQEGQVVDGNKSA
jgi:hypothetical protein